MKLVVTIILSMVTVLAQAQVSQGQHEVSASYGVFSAQQWINSSWGGSGGQLVRDAGPNYFLTYRYYLGGRFSLGLTAGKQKFSGVYEDDDGKILHRFTFDYTTVAAECFLNYLNRHHFRFYSFLGLGCSVHTEKYDHFAPNTVDSSRFNRTRTGFNFQYVPLGLSFGGRLAAFVELGFGYKGLVNAGLSFRFPYHDQPFTYTRQNYRNPY